MSTYQSFYPSTSLQQSSTNQQQQQQQQILDETIKQHPTIDTSSLAEYLRVATNEFIKRRRLE